MKTILFLTALFFLFIFDAQAETATERFERRTDELVSKLDTNQYLQLKSIQDAHGTLRAMDDVRASLERAVTSCSAEHAGYKEDLDAALKNWHAALDPEIARGQDRLDDMIKRQSVGTQASIWAYLKLWDGAVAEKRGNVTEVPITQKRACKKLISNMEDTARTLPAMMVDKLHLDTPLRVKGE